MNTSSESSTKRRRASTARTAGRGASSTRAPKARIRVLIADDHAVVREGLVSMIQRNKADMTASVPLHLVAKLADRVSGETLSKREIEVLKLMAKGKSNKEIASALFISEGTVKSHGKAIFAKMNVVSRTEAVAEATRRGLIRL